MRERKIALGILRKKKCETPGATRLNVE